ncbi:tetratricopeptide repeat protein [Hyphomonas sp. WL0036]|uniref:tetratricopeptide repeat protein n=1 Tax=Hyphomonas sediminis TaxID=2866160 RepID=UPI001C7EB175|nr:tetratricopeptide repeat protein [Hyphomonas sediminis]MBY9067301.1 tetratricopeptide repeat protein [Hyphomonas sediminis]
MKPVNIIILGSCLALGAAGYFMIGKPGMADQPMAERQAELIERVRTDPESLTEAEMLSRLEQAVIDKPEDPQPHYFIGEILRTKGRTEDAVRAYQSALRRDQDFVPALVGLADVLTQLSEGAIGPDATRLYARAYELDETQVSAGMRAAMGAAQAGEQEKAEQAMRYIYSRLPEDDPRRERFRPMIEAIGQAPPEAE